MAPTAFASARALTEPELSDAPVRYPRPSRLARALEVEGAKSRQAAESLGLITVGDLLEHLPRDRREARSVAQLAPGETATVVVEVRRIASRPVRRRGMRPLVEATVADETGAMKATFFNQPWLADRYPAGTRLVLHGKYEARNRFRVQAHAQTADSAGAGGSGEVAHYPATEGLSSTQILALVRAHADALDDVPEPLPVVAARARAPARPPRGAGRRPLRQPSASRSRDAGGWPSTSSCWPNSPSCTAAGCAVHSATAPVLAGQRELTERWLSTMLPFELTGDQEAAIAELDEDLAAAAADAAAADGGGRVGQDRRRAVRAAARGRARAARAR